MYLPEAHCSWENVLQEEQFCGMVFIRFLLPSFRQESVAQSGDKRGSWAMDKTPILAPLTPLFWPLTWKSMNNEQFGLSCHKVHLAPHSKIFANPCRSKTCNLWFITASYFSFFVEGWLSAIIHHSLLYRCLPGIPRPRTSSSPAARTAKLNANRSDRQKPMYPVM